MPDINRVEHLVAWQEARQSCRAIGALAAREAFDPHPELRSRVIAAALDLFARIAEGYGHRHEPCFVDYLVKAQDLAATCHALLYASLDAGCIDQQSFDDAAEQVQRTAKHVRELVAFLRRLARSERPTPADPADFFPKEIYNHLNESMEIQELIS